jgi:flagellar basal-body rod modification protein FlgD
MSSINPTQPASSGSSAPTNPSTNMNDQDFLQLLVAQLKYQDPMSPTDDQSFIQEQAQFSTVEGITSLESTMTTMGQQQQLSSAVNLIGTQVDYTASDGSAQSGLVSSVSNTGGTVALQIGSANVALGSITKVQLPTSTPASTTQGTTGG